MKIPLSCTEMKDTVYTKMKEEMPLRLAWILTHYISISGLSFSHRGVTAGVHILTFNEMRFVSFLHLHQEVLIKLF